MPELAFFHLNPKCHMVFGMPDRRAPFKRVWLSQSQDENRDSVMQQLFTFELPALNFLKHQSRLLFNASYTPSPFTEHASQYKTFKLPHFGHRFQMIAHLFHIEKVHNPLCNIILGNNVKQSYTYQSYQIFKSVK